MTQTERDELRDRLDDFSRRLNAHVRDLKERGEFSEFYRRSIEEIRGRQNQIRQKIAAAEGKGSAWAAIQAEIGRDFESLFDDLRLINERLDAEEMKGRH